MIEDHCQQDLEQKSRPHDIPSEVYIAIYAKKGALESTP